MSMYFFRYCVVIALLFVQFPMGIFSQENPFRLGIQGNLNISGFALSHSPKSEDPSLKIEPVGNFSMNGYISWRNPNGPGLSFEPGVSIRGAVVRSDLSRHKLFRMSYLQLPLLVDFYPSEQFTISLGIESAWLISLRELPDLGEKPLGRDFKKWDFSAALGFSVNTHKHLDWGMRYQYGLTPSHQLIFNQDPGNPATVRNHYMKVFVRLFIEPQGRS